MDIHAQCLWSSAIVCAMMCSGLADAATRYVSPCGQDFWTGLDVNCIGPHGPKRTIQAAINASLPGDTIRVLPGVYVGLVDFDGKEITLEGLGGPEVTIIDGGGDGPVVLCNSLEGPGTTLTGFTIRNGFTDNFDGGGMMIALGTVTVSNCIFEDNVGDTPAYCGGLAAHGSVVTVIDCEFRNNWGWFGGGMYLNGSTATVSNCTFDENNGYNVGGGMYINDSNVEIVESSFTRGIIEGDGFGAALFIDNTSDVVMTNCLIANNTPPDGTPGVHVDDESALTMTGCNFNGNVNSTDNQHGGALVAKSSTVTMFGCQFSDNHADGHGGAIYGENLHLTATFCGFLENHAEGDGGAIVISGISSLTASLCTFNGNTSDQWRGGAIAAYYQLPIVLNSCVFSNNSIGPIGKGGALFQMGGSLLASGCIFTGNQAPEAGAINVQDLDGEAVFVDCTFEANVAYDGDGGAIRAVNETPVSIEGGSFDSNEASNIGGAIVFEAVNAPFVMADVVFNANSAETAAGAVSTVAPTLVTGCSFVGNSSLDAGALAIGTSFGDTRIYNSRFAANSAIQVGSAIMAGAFSSGPSVDLVNCVIDNNTSAFGGGAIHESALGAHVRIYNTSIVNNIGGGLVIANGASTTEVANSIVWGNTQGGGITGNLPLVRFSNVQGGAMGSTSISLNPQFVNPAAGDYRLGRNSPCIDAGHNWLLPFDLGDLDNDGDDEELVPFDFAGNPRVMDDPAKAGSVCSNSPAIVDMGPYESAGTALEPARLGDTVTSETLLPPADGIVDGADLAVLLGAWGPCDGCCPADLDLDGTVDGWDLALLIASWG